MDLNFLIQDNKKTDLYLFLLEPLSVIIKLAIIGNKPVGTKIYIDSHIIYFQAPGPFQSLCRYVLKSNKTDIQYLYNPIELACKIYLNEPFVAKYPDIVKLFKAARSGLERLCDTYRTNNIICLCFNYFDALIEKYMSANTTMTLFKPDIMSGLYTDELVSQFQAIWTNEHIKIVLNLTHYLAKDNNNVSDIKALENIIEGIDQTVISMM